MSSRAVPLVRPGPWTDAGLTQMTGSPVSAEAFITARSASILRARVVREKAPGVPVTLRGRDVECRRRGCVDETGHARSGRGEHDRSRAGDVDLEHRPWVGEAEGIHPGHVVDDLTARERGFERRSVAEVAAHRFGPELPRGAERRVGAGQGSYRPARCNQLLDDRPTEEAGRPGHTRPASHAANRAYPVAPRRHRNPGSTVLSEPASRMWAKPLTSP